AAVVQEAEATDLIALEAVVAGTEEQDLRHAEHADLLVQVTEVRHLQVLRLVLERRLAVGAEEAGLVDVEVRVAVRIETVTTVAVLQAVGGRTKEEVLARRLVGSQRVIEG